MKKSIQSPSAGATRRIARELAGSILKEPLRKGALVLAFKGELGAGKTSFIKGLAKGLGVQGNVLSPTFLILKSYPLAQGRTFWHADCYRLSSPRELAGLGFKEIVKDPGAIVAVEWADKVSSLLPRDALWILLSHKGPLTREIRFG
ncbi:MAG: tRNA (adenosine(37)-N6)-threonylcarbamoyltransferase complex ATPase subunit type 1 TsaE [bacterium]|nr:tRNA (adenosine(37)-N6)-threonylcarbamoyltransferase complex ATPase subunit type 1 TsaE [bacterium]